MDSTDFEEWLRSQTNLSSYSIKRCSNAIRTISSELIYYGLPECDLFETHDIEFINLILKSPEFSLKNSKGNRMYSAALNHLKNYIICYEERRFTIELSFAKAELMRQVEDVTTHEPDGAFHDSPRSRPEHRMVFSRKIWTRDPEVVRGTLIDAGFLCEFDASHSTFISRVSDRNYVEAHHLIPLGCQEHFLNSLNVRANVVSLCPMCHRLLHLGKFPEKKVLLDHLFVVRQARLESSGIFTTAKELYS